MNTNNQSERLFPTCTFTPIYIVQRENHQMSESLPATTSEYYTPIREIGSSQGAQFTYPIAGKKEPVVNPLQKGRNTKRSLKESSKRVIPWLA